MCAAIRRGTKPTMRPHFYDRQGQLLSCVHDAPPMSRNPVK